MYTPLTSFSSRRLADALLSWGVRGARRPNNALVTPLTTPLTTPRAFSATLLAEADLEHCWEICSAGYWGERL